MARISVVVPVYNVQDYLEWCLDSLRAQTLEDIEIVCVNDGSTDASPEVLARCAEADSRIRVVNKPNGGLSSARNAGIREASAPYVCFLDSDDRFTPNACQRMVETFESTGADVVTFGGNAYPAEAAYPWLTDTLSPRDAEYAPFSPDLLFKEKSRPFAWRTACRTDFLREGELYFDETVKFGEDQVWQFAIYPRAAKTVLISDKLYDYRVAREGSLMRQVVDDLPTKMREHMCIAEVILADWHRAGFLAQWPSEMAAWLVEFYLYDALPLPQDARVQLFADASAQIKRYWSADMLQALTCKKATAAIFGAAAKGTAPSNRVAKALQVKYYAQQYGVGTAVRHALGR